MSGLHARGLEIPGRLARTDLVLHPATLAVLIGINGSGKTSLLHAIAGIGHPRGTVTIGDRSLVSTSPRARPALLGYVPASRGVAWPMTVRAFVALTAPVADMTPLFDDLDLHALAERRVDTLSTGERSRVFLARALLPEPAVLLLDEPFANLDPLWHLRLAAMLPRLAANGTTILMTAHDLELAERLGGRVLVMHQGRIVGDGTLPTLIADGTIAKVFGIVRDARGVWRPG